MTAERHFSGLKTATVQWVLLALAAVSAAQGEAGTVATETDLSMYEAKRILRGGTVNPKWLADGSAFYYKDATHGGTRIVHADPARNSVELVFDESRFLRALGELGIEDATVADVELPSLRPANESSTVLFTIADRAVELNLQTYQARFVVRDLAEGRKDPAVSWLVAKSFPMTWPDQYEIPSPDHSAFLGIVDYDVSVRSAMGNFSMATSDGTKGKPWQLRGASWSPDGTKFAALRADRSTLATLDVVDWNNPYHPPETFFDARAGGPLPTYSGAIFTGGTRTEFELGSEPYVRSLGWRLDSAELFIAKLSRDAKRLEIVAVDALTGDIRTVLVEESETFLYFPPNVIYRNGVPFHLLQDNRRFVWGSERSGWMQFYLYSLDGEFLGPITGGEYPVVQFGGETSDGRRILYTASGNADRPYDAQVYSASIAGGDVRRLSDAPGQHEMQVSPSGSFYLDKHSTTAKLPVTELRREDGTLVRVLSKATLPAGTGFTEPEHFVAKAADGVTDIYGVLFKPAGFDPRKSYPVVENIYAGGFVTYVPYSFDSGQPYYGNFLFDGGYVEVVIDGRGTPGRGKAFQDVVYGNLGQHEIADHATALEQAAATRPWMDTCRVGIFGNSYGGYFALRALLQAPGVYDVAVAAGTPVQDGDNSALASEVYLGLYSPESQAWKRASNLSLVDRLRGRLLLIQGTSDVNTPLYGPFKVADALIRADKPFDMLVLPNVNHHYHGADFSHRRYMEQAIVRYFDEHLKPGSSRRQSCNRREGDTEWRD